MAGAANLICIVDDDPSVRRALGRMVTSFGYGVQLLASGRECLDGPHIDRAACLILDVSMPGMDGFELCALLQASGRSVPTVFISAHDDEGYRAKARSVGAVAYLDKPCDESLLRDAVDNAVASYDAPGS
jgi:FixJ family two-component response regulator